VQFGTARKPSVLPTRVLRRTCLASLLVLFGLGPQAANANDTRTLSLHNIHTKEDLTITFKKNGRFDDDALKRLNAFMRDWRKEEEVRMDPQLFDMLWEVHREVKASGPIHVVCGYRSPATNAMLRSRSGGVARTSLHMQGKAIDFSIPSAEVADVRAAALRIQGGGVGYYPTSGIPFVHMDVGSVRHWPRMTRDQLAKVFPNGRTLHVPTDGNPLPGYELAAADRERGGGLTPGEAAQPQRSLLAALFGGTQDAEEAADNSAAPTATRPPVTNARRAAPPAVAPTAAVATAVEAAKPVPLPPSRPTFQVASAQSTPVAAPAPRRPTNLGALSPNEIIGARGYWQGLPDAPPETPIVSASRRTASADPDATASIGPFVRNDRVPPEVALSYASQPEPQSALAAALGSTARRVAAAVVTSQGTASIATKSVALGGTSANVLPLKPNERLNDPWLRGLVVSPSVQAFMTTTVFGAPDFRRLQPFIEKPASTVMMTFSNDPHLGMTAEAFSGSAVVFQATVTFGTRTAFLQQ